MSNGEVDKMARPPLRKPLPPPEFKYPDPKRDYKTGKIIKTIYNTSKKLSPELESLPQSTRHSNVIEKTATKTERKSYERDLKSKLPPQKHETHGVLWKEYGSTPRVSENYMGGVIGHDQDGHMLYFRPTVDKENTEKVIYEMKKYGVKPDWAQRKQRSNRIKVRKVAPRKLTRKITRKPIKKVVRRRRT